MKQELTDPPKTEQEARRKKGPTPLIAIGLAIGLAWAFLAFFVPAYIIPMFS